MRKTLQRRPGFEALESMTLLSGMAGAATPTALLPVAAHLSIPGASGQAGASDSTADPNAIHLTGTIIGSATPSSTESTSGLSRVKLQYTAIRMSGPISPLGHVTVSGTLSATGGGFLTITGKQGRLSVGYVGKRTATGLVGTYTIYSGQKAYRGATGTGDLEVMRAGTPAQGRFIATFS